METEPKKESVNSIAESIGGSLTSAMEQLQILGGKPEDLEVMDTHIHSAQRNLEKLKALLIPSETER